MIKPFEAAGIGFEADDGYTAVAFSNPHHFLDAGFGERLRRAGLAPVDSWLAARLHRLLRGDRRVFTGDVEVEAEGLFVVDVLAVDDAGRVLAKLQLQTRSDEAGLMGVSTSPGAADAILSAFWSACMKAPAELDDVTVRIARTLEEPTRSIGRIQGKLL